MTALAGALEQRLQKLTLPLAIVLPGGRRIGVAGAAVTVRLKELLPLTHIVTGQIGKFGEDYVEGRLEFDGSMRDLMALGAELMPGDPTDASAVGPTPIGWLRRLVHLARSRALHRPEADARQIQFHYDVSDEFYALWLDPRRVYSCAYFRDAGDVAGGGPGSQARAHLPEADAARRASASSTSAPAGAACCCGRPSTTACGRTASRSAATSMPTSTG